MVRAAGLQPAGRRFESDSAHVRRPGEHGGGRTAGQHRRTGAGERGPAPRPPGIPTTRTGRRGRGSLRSTLVACCPVLVEGFARPGGRCRTGGGPWLDTPATGDSVQIGPASDRVGHPPERPPPSHSVRRAHYVGRSSRSGEFRQLVVRLTLDQGVAASLSALSCVLEELPSTGGVTWLAAEA